MGARRMTISGAVSSRDQFCDFGVLLLEHKCKSNSLSSSVFIYSCVYSFIYLFGTCRVPIDSNMHDFPTFGLGGEFIVEMLMVWLSVRMRRVWILLYTICIEIVLRTMPQAFFEGKIEIKQI